MEKIMAIRRTINGQEWLFMLTDEEIQKVYCVEQAKNDSADIINRIEQNIDPEDPDDAEVHICGIDTTAGKLRALLADDEAIDEMAHELREKLDGHCMVSDIVGDLCDEVIKDQIY